MVILKKVIKRNCYFSDCKLYRWSLDLNISYKKKEIIFIGLNPSFSDYEKFDNTTKKIIKICDRHNYGKIKLINLFGLISSSPRLLKLHHDPIGHMNNYILHLSLNYWSKSIACDLWIGWGNKGGLFKRDLEVYEIVQNYISQKQKSFSKSPKPLYIKKTKANNPIHPLYCKDNSKLQESI